MRLPEVRPGDHANRADYDMIGRDGERLSSRCSGHAEVEVTRQAEDGWMDMLLSAPPRPTVVGSTECTPGYYNNEGKGAGQGAFFSVGHPEGAMAFFEPVRCP